MIDSFLTLTKLIRERKCYIDERVFRLHCLFTSALLFLFCVIISTKQIAGEPIDCEINRDSVKPSFLNTYCLIHYTYTIREGFFKRIGVDVAAPGIKFGHKEEEIHYNYYQWVWFLFFTQALCFYFPRWLWKSFECGTMAFLVNDFKEFMSEGKKKQKKRVIANYMVKGHTQAYGRHYLFCLILAFCNVLLQMTFINFLVNGEFYTYGYQVFSFLKEDPNNRRDALIKVFPRLTKCRFHKFGSSGSLQSLDALCVLPLNMYNEVIYIFLWFWFVILALLLFLSIGVKLILMSSPLARLYFLQKQFGLKVCWNEKDENYLNPRALTFGDILILVLVKQNTGHTFASALAKELITKRRKSVKKVSNISKQKNLDLDFKVGSLEDTSERHHHKSEDSNHVNNPLLSPKEEIIEMK